MRNNFIKYSAKALIGPTLFLMLFLFVHPYFIKNQTFSDSLTQAIFVGLFWGTTILVYSIIEHNLQKGETTLSSEEMELLTNKLLANQYAELKSGNQAGRTFIQKKSNLFSLSMLVIKPLSSEQWLISWSSKKERSLVLG